MSSVQCRNEHLQSMRWMLLCILLLGRVSATRLATTPRKVCTALDILVVNSAIRVKCLLPALARVMLAFKRTVP